MFRRMTMVAAALLGVGIAAHTAVADESGTFTIVGSFQHSYVTIEHPDESFTGGALNGTLTFLDSSGAPFVDGANGKIECLLFSRSSDDGIALQAPCVSTDSEGDMLYAMSRREQGTIESGGGGRWELLGGTGKYQGITGSCTYETQYMEDNWAVSLGQCTWSK